MADNDFKDPMLYWAVTFLIIAVVAPMLGITGLAIISKQIAWVLFLSVLIYAVVTFVFARRAT